MAGPGGRRPRSLALALVGVSLLIGIVLGGGSPAWRRLSPAAVARPLAFSTPRAQSDRLLEQEGAKLTGAGAVGASGFGLRVALSADGDTALIGGPGDEGLAGAAWVFTRSGSTWVQQGPKLVGGDEVGGGEFGDSVALSRDGDTALIGGRNDDGHVGAVWLFTRSGSTWTQQGPKLVGGGEVGEGEFGGSVALSGDGDTALIGGWADDGDLGAAWVFTRSGSTWTQQGPKLLGSGVVGIPFIGKSVALSADGDTALVGGPWDKDVGAVWVFTRSGSTWTQQGPKLVGAGEAGKGFFGESVALSADGDTALIGAPSDGSDVGAAWVFARAGSTWTQQGAKILAGEERGPASFGESVALSSDGSTALIGGWRDENYAGAGWLFARTGTTWAQQGTKLVASGESPDGQVGVSAALSGDGATALLGGRGEDAAWAFAEGQEGPTGPARFGRCTRVPAKRDRLTAGSYANRSCTQASASGAYEWHPGTVRSGFALAGGRASLQTVGGWRLSCQSESGGGKYSGAGLTTVGALGITFLGCEHEGQPCSSAEAPAGQILVGELDGELGVIAPAEQSGGDELGLRLAPAVAGPPVVAFDCDGIPVSARGSVIAPLVTDRMRPIVPLRLVSSKRRQRPQALVGAPPSILEVSVDLGPFEAAALQLRATQTNEEAVEADASA